MDHGDTSASGSEPAERAKKSTGPRTQEGKNRARFNALDHGCRSSVPVLPTESEEDFEAATRDWKLSLQPRNPLEDFLVDQLGTLAWQTKRVDRADTARLTSRIYHGDRDEMAQKHEQAIELSHRLFGYITDPSAPPAEERNRLGISPHDVGTDHPARLIARLEGTGAGCEWLLEQWTRLRGLLDEGLAWQADDKHKAVRLLGRLPIDAVDDISTACVYLAAARLEDGNEDDPFRDVLKDLGPDGAAAYEARLRGRNYSRLAPGDAATARQVLIEMANGAIESLTAKVEMFRELAELDAATAAARLSFDTTPDGERLRRYSQTHHRAWFRTFDLFMKIRRGDPSLTFASLATTIRSLPDQHRPEPETAIRSNAADFPEAAVAGEIIRTSAAMSPAADEINRLDAAVSSAAVVATDDETIASAVAASTPAGSGSDHLEAPNEPNFSVQNNTTMRLDAAEEGRVNRPHGARPVAATARGSLARSILGGGRLPGDNFQRARPELPGQQRPLMNLSSIFGPEKG